MKAPLVESLQLELNGVPASIRLASLIVLSVELSHLHRHLGYNGTGRRTVGEKESGEVASWEKYCRINAGITEATHRAYRQCFDVLTRRLLLLSHPESKDLLELLAMQPSTLAPERRKSLIEDIARLALLPGDTASSIRKEFRTPEQEHPEPKITRGSASITVVTIEDPAAKIEAYALACGVSPENASRVADILRGEQFMMKMAPLAAQLYLKHYAGKSRKPSKNGHHKS